MRQLHLLLGLRRVSTGDRQPSEHLKPWIGLRDRSLKGTLGNARRVGDAACVGIRVRLSHQHLHQRPLRANAGFDFTDVHGRESPRPFLLLRICGGLGRSRPNARPQLSERLHGRSVAQVAHQPLRHLEADQRFLMAAGLEEPLGEQGVSPSSNVVHVVCLGEVRMITNRSEAPDCLVEMAGSECLEALHERGG